MLKKLIAIRNEKSSLKGLLTKQNKAKIDKIFLKKTVKG